MKRRNREPGSFWPQVRAKIWEVAEELYMWEKLKTMGEDFVPVRPERSELMKAGYFDRAKRIVLRGLRR